MPEVTDKDLDAKREKNDKLRQQIEDAEAQAAERLVTASREVEASQLDAETARLEARLAAAREAAKVSVIKDGASNVIDANKEQQKTAEAIAAAPQGPVDTNADKSDDDEKKG